MEGVGLYRGRGLDTHSLHRRGFNKDDIDGGERSIHTFHFSYTTEQYILHILYILHIQYIVNS
jgi:hypothetical protein